MTPVIAIVGRPNVGKSSLFNRLTRSRNALVDDQPGVTRDRIYGKAVFDGNVLTFVDTGGLAPRYRDSISSQVALQVEKAIEEAQAIILVVDAREGLIPADVDIADLLRPKHKKVFVAANKVDGPEMAHL